MAKNHKEQQLLAIIERYRTKRGALIQILHEAQQLYGYMSIEAQELISREMHIPLTEIYGVITFYGQFALQPKGKYRIAVCMGTACYVKGAGDILERFKQLLGIEVGQCTVDGLFSLEACRCIGACGLAPVITINEDVHGRLTSEDVQTIIARYRQNGNSNEVDNENG